MESADLVPIWSDCLDGGKLTVWCFGHAPHPLDFTDSGVRFVCNPRGRPCKGATSPYSIHLIDTSALTGDMWGSAVGNRTRIDVLRNVALKIGHISIARSLGLPDRPLPVSGECRVPPLRGLAVPLRCLGLQCPSSLSDLTENGSKIEINIQLLAMIIVFYYLLQAILTENCSKPLSPTGC